jgi:hypothetical protein
MPRRHPSTDRASAAFVGAQRPDITLNDASALRLREWARLFSGCRVPSRTVQPYPVVPRIPVDQPFIVRPSVRKRVVFFGSLVTVLLVFLGCVLSWGAAGSSNSIGLLIVFLGIAVLFVGLFGLQIWLLATGGPVLAVGPAGLWIKTRPSRGQAIWLPWEAIGLISRRRWSFEKMLCVAPRDPRAGQQLGAFTAFDSVVTQAAFGTGFTATLNFADQSEQEILQAVAYFAAGRVQLA